jgi:6-phosphogluconolactonase
MPANAEDLHAAAGAYAEEMHRVLGDPPRLDVALLGVGPDGHVCSLFPGHPLLREQRRLVAAIEDSPKPPPRRLTLTLPALTSVDLVVVAALGDAKAAPVCEALDDPESPLPVALVVRRARRVLWLLDEPAARLL